MAVFLYLVIGATRARISLHVLLRVA